MAIKAPTQLLFRINTAIHYLLVKPVLESTSVEFWFQCSCCIPYSAWHVIQWHNKQCCTVACHPVAEQAVLYSGMSSSGRASSVVQWHGIPWQSKQCCTVACHPVAHQAVLYSSMTSHGTASSVVQWHAIQWQSKQCCTVACHSVAEKAVLYSGMASRGRTNNKQQTIMIY